MTISLVLSGTEYVTTLTSGSYTMTLWTGGDGVGRGLVVDVSSTFTGDPTKVAADSRGRRVRRSVVVRMTGTRNQLQIGASSGNIYALDIAAKLVRKFSSAGSHS